MYLDSSLADSIEPRDCAVMVCDRCKRIANVIVDVRFVGDVEAHKS